MTYLKYASSTTLIFTFDQDVGKSFSIEFGQGRSKNWAFINLIKFFF